MMKAQLISTEDAASHGLDDDDLIAIRYEFGCDEDDLLLGFQGSRVVAGVKKTSNSAQGAYGLKRPSQSNVATHAYSEDRGWVKMPQPMELVGNIDECCDSVTEVESVMHADGATTEITKSARKRPNTSITAQEKEFREKLRRENEKEYGNFEINDDRVGNARLIKKSTQKMQSENGEHVYERDWSCPMCDTDHKDQNSKCDYEECGYCGFDHTYEPEQALAWHRENDPDNRLYESDDVHSITREEIKQYIAQKQFFKGKWRQLNPYEEPKKPRGVVSVDCWSTTDDHGRTLYLSFEMTTVYVNVSRTSRLRDPSKTKYRAKAVLSVTPWSSGGFDAEDVFSMGTSGESKEREFREKADARMMRLFGVDPHEYLKPKPMKQENKKSTKLVEFFKAQLAENDFTVRAGEDVDLPELSALIDSVADDWRSDDSIDEAEVELAAHELERKIKEVIVTVEGRLINGEFFR